MVVNCCCRQTVLTEPPTITSVSPGALSCGTPVELVITGTNLTPLTQVIIGGVQVAPPPASAVSDDGTTLTLTIDPPDADGTFDVTVTNQKGTATLPAAVTVTPCPDPLTVTDISPDPVASGATTSLVITGTGFTTGTSVTIVGTAVSATVDSDTQITVTGWTAPTLAEGGEDSQLTVAVTRDDDDASDSIELTVTAPDFPALTLTDVDPSPVASGSTTPTLTLTGSGFRAPTSVSIDGVPPAASVVVDPTFADAAQNALRFPAAWPAPADGVATVPDNSDSMRIWLVGNRVASTSSAAPDGTAPGNGATPVTAGQVLQMEITATASVDREVRWQIHRYDASGTVISGPIYVDSDHLLTAGVPDRFVSSWTVPADGTAFVAVSFVPEGGFGGSVAITNPRIGVRSTVTVVDDDTITVSPWTAPSVTADTALDVTVTRTADGATATLPSAIEVTAPVVDNRPVFQFTVNTLAAVPAAGIAIGGCSADNTIDWGDGTTETLSAGTSGNDATVRSHTYATAGDHVVTYRGTFDSIGSSLQATVIGRLVSIDRWDPGVCPNPWNARNLGYSATMLTKIVTPPPGVTDFAQAFRGANQFTGGVKDWDVSQATVGYSAFNNCPKFNEDISGWDVSKITSLGSFFSSCTIFNQPIGGWNTGAATSMSSMFLNASAFNQDLSGWDVDQVTNHSSFNSSANAAWVNNAAYQPHWVN